ncbi:hypothetical protein BN8_00532 [Fibrisoma limi BUZ 3]|uniref:Uncharacterized protein n=1 Tax=Fibrisoma limi BUZ 3 TaxID=1185876 RepID=I2GCH4_9BACT|nr:WYL domain-containing protein [Fibrisoma limi]CCH51598.1 hypothetical protein BN8_00532 [Fibrisoma limi BUZ 3]
MPRLNSAEVLRQRLNAGAQLTYQQIQHLTGLGDKQASRLIRQLQREGLPVQEHRNGRHKVFSLPADRQQVMVPDLQFDSAELRALAIAAKASRSMLSGTPHAQALQSAFDKLLDRARPATYLFDLEEPMNEWHFDDNSADQIALDCFRQLETAMDERRSVKIDYFTASKGRLSKSRKVDPYFFALRNRAWMLVAYCHTRAKPITFAVASISQVTPCDETTEDAFFEIPADFVPEDFFRGSLGAISTGECYELRLLVEPNKAAYFRRRLYHPTQQVENEQPDGRLIVSYELEGFEEMRSFCQSWGVGITVLEPVSLRDRLYQEAQVLLERYGA